MTRLRQLAFVAADLDAATAQLTGWLGLEVAHRDPSVAMFGLANVVLPVGEQDFLEVVSPIEAGTTAGRYLERRGGDAGYMVIVQVDDLAAARARVEAAGVRVVQAFEGDGHGSLHLHPKDCGGVLLSLDVAPDAWAAAGPDWPAHVRTEVTTGFRSLAIAVEDPGSVARLWARLLDLPLVDGDRLRLDNVELDFIGAGHPGDVGVAALDLVCGPGGRGGETRLLCGVRTTLVAEP